MYVRGLIVGPFLISAKLISLVIFVAYSLSGGVITPEFAFTTICIVKVVRVTTTLFIPFALEFSMGARELR